MSEEEFGIHREYKGIISIEQLVARQIDRINEYGTQGHNEEYISAVEHLIDMLPPEHEIKATEYKKEHGIGFDLSPEGKMRYRALFRFIKGLFSKDNIVWKKARYEVGTERPKRTKENEEVEEVEVEPIDEEEKEEDEDIKTDKQRELDRKRKEFEEEFEKIDKMF